MGTESEGAPREWRFPAKPECVPVMRHRVAQVVAGLGVDEEAVALTVTEAVANAVRHAYPGGGGEVRLAVSVDDQEVVLLVTDEGIGVRGFTASRSADAGLGLGLIRALSSRVRIEPSSDGTLVEMAFRRR
jgi:anti-sigma regulatory factor (Ser/Thr protein kinase)